MGWCDDPFSAMCSSLYKAGGRGIRIRLRTMAETAVVRGGNIDITPRAAGGSWRGLINGGVRPDQRPTRRLRVRPRLVTPEYTSAYRGPHAGKMRMEGFGG